MRVKIEKAIFYHWRTFLCVWVAVACSVASAASKFMSPRLPASPWADTEIETNLVFNAGNVQDNRWKVSIELDATYSNNVEVVFGVDGDYDGKLARNERELSIGFDCGEWFIKDWRSDTNCWSQCQTGRRRLDLTIYLKGDDRHASRMEGPVFSGDAPATYFNPDWNLARVVARGVHPTSEDIVSVLSVNPLIIRVR